MKRHGPFMASGIDAVTMLVGVRGDNARVVETLPLCNVVITAIGVGVVSFGVLHFARNPQSKEDDC